MVESKKCKDKKLSLDCSEQQLVLVETVVVELVPVVEGGALGLQHHQGLLGEAKPALAGGPVFIQWEK